MSAVVDVVTLGGELRLEVKVGVPPGCEGQSQGKGASVFFNSGSCDERSMSPFHTAPTHLSSTSPLTRSAVIQL